MTVMITAEIPGGTEEQDNAMMAEMGVRTDPPKGILFRAAGPIPGGWRICTLWENREDFELFYRDRIGPANKKLGVAPALITFWTPASYRIPPSR